MTRVVSVGFDGLNRSGKSIQIKLLQEYLESRNLPYAICRGDGVRFGIGKKPYDSHSGWWVANVNTLLNKTDPNRVGELLNLQYQRLCREFAIRSRILKRKAINSGVEEAIAILDRSYVSRYFTMRQYYPSINLEEALRCKNPANGKFIEPIVPDLTFIMVAPKEVLIKRVLETEKGERLNIIREIIARHYDLFSSTVDCLKDRADIRLLNAEKQPEENFAETMRILKNEFNI